MADFYQHARVPTLHHLAHADAALREEELREWSVQKPVVLLLPALYAECERPALPLILERAADLPYVSEIVLSMNSMDAAQHELTLELCRRMLRGKPARIIWNDSPEMGRAFELMEQADLPGYLAGKGTNIWMGVLELHSRGFDGVVASHDTDILNFSRDLIWRLCYPLMHPRMGYRFAKGYYSRVAERLYGRVTRLLIFPLIQACRDVLGPKPLIEHLESFRYPLSGEFAADMSAINSFSLPGGWGLEIASMCETHHKMPVSEVCQVDLGFHFEHRHRSLNPGKAGVREPGLVTAAADVARCLAWQVLRDSEPRSAEEMLRLIVARYHIRATEWLARFEHVALLNGLEHDPAEETAAVNAFGHALEQLLKTAAVEGLRVPAMRPPVRSVLQRLPEIGSFIQAATTIV
jgi:glucosyl-3-phosphoglycerate synthase